MGTPIRNTQYAIRNAAQSGYRGTQYAIRNTQYANPVKLYCVIRKRLPQYAIAQNAAYGVPYISPQNGYRKPPVTPEHPGRDAHPGGYDGSRTDVTVSARVYMLRGAPCGQHINPMIHLRQSSGEIFCNRQELPSVPYFESSFGCTDERRTCQAVAAFCAFRVRTSVLKRLRTPKRRYYR